MKGTLYLVPVTLGSTSFKEVIPDEVIRKAKEIRNYIVEDLRSARRFLRLIDGSFPIDSTVFRLLNEHTSPEEYEGLIEPLLMGHDVGLMSEAGVPGVADPGAPVVLMAHRKGIRVVPLTGPSSLLLALMASGLNGQFFAFHGYLPVKRNERINSIKKLEHMARKGQAQVFMEAPYRNQKLLEDILEICGDDLLLSLSIDLTLSSEQIKTLPVNEWKINKPEINKKPAIFILGCC